MFLRLLQPLLLRLLPPCSRFDARLVFQRKSYILKLTGRCFRLVDFYQRDEGDLGQLEMRFQDMTSHLLKRNGIQVSCFESSELRWRRRNFVLIQFSLSKYFPIFSRNWFFICPTAREMYC